MQVKLPRVSRRKGRGRLWHRVFIPIAFVRLEEDKQGTLRMLLLSRPYTRKSVGQHRRLWTFTPQDFPLPS